jgi:hypothetical protein
LGWWPVPIGGKQLLVKGYTGHEGAPVTTAEVGRWIHDFGQANVTLRLPAGVIGIDVDAYDERAGARTLALAEELWGPLPPAWTLTSRDDGVSGIRLFRVEPGLLLKTQLVLEGSGGIEIIQRHHRYVTVPGSIHATTGQPYRWVAPDGRESPESPPPGAVGPLPDAWAAGLAATDRHPAGVATPGAANGASELMAGLPGGEPDARVERTLGRAVRCLTGGAGAGLLLAAPVLIAIAVAVRCESGPGFIFRQQRVGIDGRPFTLLKFRSLKPLGTEGDTKWTIYCDRASVLSEGSSGRAASMSSRSS